MASLRQNFIVDGKLYQRGSVVDAELISPHLHTPAHIDRDLQDQHGLVLLLRDLSFQSLPRSSASGIPTSFPTQCAAGELLDLAQVPESCQKSLKEGEDFKTAWTYEEQKELQARLHDGYLKQFETEAVPTYRSR
jgi:hypothetical protein